ncbi:MAG TPA: DUF3422 domain-containing protein [Xanthobacteraceae bacterium]
MGGGTLVDHPLRAAVLGELHARPFTPIETPRRILHFGFLIDAAAAQAERTALVAFCTGNSIPAPSPTAKHHRCTFGSATLRWENHAEFSTYTWELPAPGAIPFEPAAGAIPNVMASVPQPGPLLVALDLHLIDERGGVMAETLFDRASLARSKVIEGAAVIATDFQPDASGFIRILVTDRDLKADRAGALVQRLLEIETYRTLALLGLPEAQRIAPAVQRIEKRLGELTEAMRRTEGLSANRELLNELTALAAELEAGAAAASFRFGASRAYHDIVRARLAAIAEQPLGGYPTWSQFLDRRMGPAMRTCTTTEERQMALSEKLSRAAQLLRTRVDVELEQQNRDLLESMNERARMQLRLQWTVEGLSVAAISYYVVGLLHYLFNGLHQGGFDARYGFRLNVELATALTVPIVVLLVAFVVRQIRRRDTDRRGSGTK